MVEIQKKESIENSNLFKDCKGFTELFKILQTMGGITGSRGKKYSADDLIPAIKILLNRFIHLQEKNNLTEITNEAINTLIIEDEKIRTQMECITKSSGLREKVLQLIKGKMQRMAKDMDDLDQINAEATDVVFKKHE